MMLVHDTCKKILYIFKKVTQNIEIILINCRFKKKLKNVFIQRISKLINDGNSKPPPLHHPRDCGFLLKVKTTKF